MANAVPISSTLTQNKQVPDFIDNDAAIPENQKTALRGNPDTFPGCLTKAPRVFTKTNRLTNLTVSRSPNNSFVMCSKPNLWFRPYMFKENVLRRFVSQRQYVPHRAFGLQQAAFADTAFCNAAQGKPQIG